MTRGGFSRARTRLVALLIAASLLTGTTAVAVEGGEGGGGSGATLPLGDHTFAFERITEKAGGGDADNSSTHVAISDDGSRLAFASYATDIVPGAGFGQVYRYDGPSQTFAVASVDDHGHFFGGRDPWISGDGDAVVFSSHHYSGEGEDLTSRSAIFRTDLADTVPAAEIVDTGLTTDSEDAVTNADGSVVAFTSGTWPTGPGTSGSWKYYVADGAGVREVGDLGTAPYPQRPAVSPDGRKVAFLRYTATDGWALWVDDDVTDGTPASARKVVDADGDVSQAYGAPSFAGNDRIAFVTAEHGYRVEMLDIATNVSAPLPPFEGSPPFSAAIEPSASADGRSITFSAIDNATGDPQIYVYDADSGDTYLVTHDADGSPSAPHPLAAGGPSRGVVSADGSTIAVETSSPDLVGEDGNPYVDIFTTPNVDTVLVDAWPEDAHLEVTGVSSSTVQLAWSAAPTATGYRVFQGGTRIADVTGTTHEVTELSPGTGYSFSVRALVGGALSSDRLSGGATTTGTAPGGGDGGGSEPVVRPITPLIANTGPGGVGVALEWEAVSDPGVTAFVVQRAPAVGDFVTIARDVPLGTTSYLDTAVAADTTYRYRVLVVENGTEQPHSWEQAFLTRALTIYGVALTAPARLVAPGSSITLQVRGSGAAAAEALVTTRTWRAENGTDVLDAPRSIDHTVPLVHSPVDSDLWEATFVLPPGTGAVSSVTARLLDGLGTAATRDADEWGLPVVAAALDVTIADQGQLAGSRLETFASWWSADGRTVEGPGVQAVENLEASDAYTVRLTDAEGRLLAEARDLVVRPGLRTAVQLAARQFVHVAVTVTDPTDAPVRWIGVTAYDGETGEYLQTAYTGDQGIARFRGLPDVNSVRLFARSWWPSDKLFEGSVERTVEVNPGDNGVDLEFAALPTGRIRGKVTVNGGDAANAAIWLTTADRWSSHSVHTGRDGTYDVEVLAGTVNMHVSSFGASSGNITGIEVAPDATVTNNVNLVAPKPYKVKPRLFTRFAGHATQEVTIAGWRMTAHYEYLNIEGPGVYTGVPFNGGAADIIAPPGTPLRFCGGGREGGLGRACSAPVPLPLDNSQPVELELTLIQPQRLVGDVVDERGEPVRNWNGTLSRSDGRVLQWLGSKGTGRLDTTATVSGDLVLTMEGSAARDGAYVRVTATPIPLSILSDGVVDVGDIVLRPAGVAFGGDGNEVRAVKPNVAPGGTAAYRVSFRNNGTSAVDDAVVRIQLPDGRDLLPNGLLLDGRPLDVGDGGTIDVPVGDLAPGASGVVTYYVPVGDAAPGDRLTTRASVVAGDLRATLGTAAAVVSGVTLIGPASTNEPSLVLRGDAPPSSTVEIFDGDDRIASAVAGRGGAWKQTALLSDRGDGSTHELRAVVALDDSTLTSAPIEVLFDPGDVVVTSMSISQEDATKKTWDPREGVARFPLVWVPGRPFDIEIEFSDNARVANVVAFVGDRSGEAELRDGKFHAEVMADGSGQLAVEYDVVAAPVTFGNRSVTPAEMRNELPLWASTFEAQGEPVTQDDGSITVSLALPGRGEGTEATTTITTTDERYEVTAADAEFEADTGVPVYGVDTSLEVADDGTVVITQTAFVPRSALPDTGAEAASVRMLMGADVRAAGGPMMKGIIGSTVDALKTRVKTELKEDVKPEDVKDWIESAQENATEGGDSYNEIGDLYEKLSDVAPGDRAALQSEIDSVLNQALATDVGNSIFEAASVFVGAPGGVVGELGMAALSEAVSKGSEQGLKRAQARIERKIDTAIARKKHRDRMEELDRWLEDQERNDAEWCRYFKKVWEDNGRRPEFAPPDPDCNPNPPAGDRRRTPTGDNPVIVDPSGFVFEGVESNRLEGVTATALFSTSPDGPWEVWDAEPFAQENPLATGADGRYAWDVPFGWWKVEYRKDGYEVGFSEPMEVLPPHFDVNEGLVSLAPPKVEAVALAPGEAAVQVTFDKHMIPGSVGPNVTVAGPNGPIAGTVAAVSPENDPDGDPLARTFAFTPAAAFPAGTLTVTVGGARSYADRAVAQPVVRTLTVTAPAPGTGGGTGGGFGTGGGAPAVPTAAQPVTAVVGNGTVTIGSGTAPAGFRLLGQPLVIEGPPATAAAPHVLRLRVHPSALKPGEIPVVWRDDRRVAAACSSPTAAAPDPCLASVADAGGQYWELVVRTSHFSTWAVTAPLAGSTTAACPAGAFPAAPFRDVTAGSTHGAAVACLAAKGVARGVAAARFDPATPVTRAQMASFLTRLLAEAGVSLPAAPAAAFGDVSGVHATAIDQLAALGIAQGTGDRRFSPTAPVTRAQMASFIVRAMEVAGAQLPDGADAFDDDGGSTHEGAIDKAAAAGIALGTGERTFVPGAPVRRDQMASFLARTLNRLVLVGKAR